MGGFVCQSPIGMDEIMRADVDRFRKKIPQEKWLPAGLWSKTLRFMPIPCVDLIFERSDKCILYGWRLINPYNDAWALVGGRMMRGENLLECASRIAKEYGLSYKELFLNGVFPVNFPKRSDLVISLAARRIAGEPRVDGFEFSSFRWAKTPPKRLGTNYSRMVTKWRKASKSSHFLELNRLL